MPSSYLVSLHNKDVHKARFPCPPHFAMPGHQFGIQQTIERLQVILLSLFLAKKHTERLKKKREKHILTTDNKGFIEK